MDVILAKSEELKRAALRRQIKGRQILLLVRQFYEVKKDRRIQLELSNLMEVSYPGDGQLAQFKQSWDNMVRNLRTPLTPEQLEDLFYRKLNNSGVLRNHMGYYDRLT